MKYGYIHCQPRDISSMRLRLLFHPLVAPPRPPLTATARDVAVHFDPAVQTHWSFPSVYLQTFPAHLASNS